MSASGVQVYSDRGAPWYDGRGSGNGRVVMTLEGTVVNGVIVPDGGATLPEGARVNIELKVRFEYPHPMAPYDREKELALLRDRLAGAQAGTPAIPLKEGMGRIAAELNLPAALRGGSPHIS
jgi:hypothetical protein